MKYIWGVFTAISLALFSCGSGSKESVENYGIIPMPNDITLSRGKYFLQGEKTVAVSSGENEMKVFRYLENFLKNTQVTLRAVSPTEKADIYLSSSG